HFLSFWQDTFSLLILFVCFITAFGGSDIKNLYALRDELVESKQFLQDWFDIESPPCLWSHITCVDKSVAVIDLSNIPLHVPFPLCITAFQALARLNLSRCDLFGEIPEALGNLKHLQYLDLSSNQLTGIVPFSLYDLKMLKEIVLDRNSLSGQLIPAIAKLQQLAKLTISKNNISGELPPEVGSLKDLEVLDFHQNSFNGSIPEALGNLSQLFYLDASKNQLTGSIFPGISTLFNLLTLDFSSNDLAGPIPKEIARMENLECLVLGSNNFTGGIPKEIGNLKKLKKLILSACNLSGTIPWSIGGLKSLHELDISDNNFKSELPASIGELGNLTVLIAMRAKLIGSIPKELGSCKKLTLLRLSFNRLTGCIPKELAGLEAIVHFEVEGNKLSGHIADWFQNWGNVVSIRLGDNKFNGSILPAICQANSLQSLDLHLNDLTGSINETFKRCRNLTQLNLQGNHFHGEIPEYLAELPLTILELPYNNFTGLLPAKLFKSSTILEIDLSYNKLTGCIPESICELHSLQRLRMSSNYLEGSIPPAVGALKNLNEISLDGNRLSGNIPQELFNCRNLVKLNLSSNNLNGSISRSISQLTSLTGLVLSHNQLSGSIPAEICGGFTNPSHPESEYVQYHGLLDLSYNRLIGRIPPEIKNCVILEELHLQDNFLNESIPVELAELKNLMNVDLSFNALVGPMLPWSTPLLKLQGLFLSNNHLTGNIPAEIGRILPNIVVLSLSCNAFVATLPQSLLCSKTLNRLDVSNNNLSGKIPLSCTGFEGTLSSLILFNASSNHFSGSLDGSISNFVHLSYLDIHNNSLNGSLPAALSNLSLLYLDVSMNDFSGAIPCGMCNLSNITFVDFSGKNTGMHSFADCAASGICAADITSTNHVEVHTPHGMVITMTICAAILIVVLLVVFVKWMVLRNSSLPLVSGLESKATIEPASSKELLGKKSREPLSINLSTFEHALLRVTMDDILKATNNFSEVHIIGHGGFGTVYEAAFPEGQRVAVKRLHGSCQFLGDRQFLAEMETIGKVKHHNLVPLLGYCARGDERFLIYEYMHHGSLETWLRTHENTPEAIGWPERLRICLGSANGLMFLHHGFVPHIIHRDMKSSNILLDENMEPKISDFGLARIISAYDTHVSTTVSGTLGYIPPEYAMIMESTARGDVYSFGVVMLEVLTGRPPTGKEVEEGGGNLVDWVRWMIACSREGELFDPRLPVSGLWREQMVRVLAIALDCTTDEPSKRPTMVEVVKGLKMVQLMKRDSHNPQHHAVQP
ncbi:leucine-rich repeat receptor protein kinase MSP1, partial [Zea mays]|uniref:leucine-rich repeat receptor protein kinase MSP1 n=1 Tax=Zea mays TaxID=4577 RepID=UPI000C6C766F